MRIIYDQQNQWRDARRSLLYKSLCVCAFIFIPWLNSVKYRKCHKMSISQVHLFQKSSCTYKFVYIYIYIHILKIHIGDWYFHTTSRASIFFGPPTTSPPFVPGCTPKYVYAKLKRLLRYKPTSLVLVWMAALRFLPPLSHKRVPSDPLEVKPSRCRWQLVNRFSPTKNACGNTSDDCWCSKTGDVNFDFGFFFLIFAVLESQTVWNTTISYCIVSFPSTFWYRCVWIVSITKASVTATMDLAKPCILPDSEAAERWPAPPPRACSRFPASSRGDSKQIACWSAVTWVEISQTWLATGGILI